jgi:integrase
VRTRPRQERRTLSEEQLGEIIRAIHELDIEHYPEVVLMAVTGMRTGELFALEWGDLDGDMLTIDRSHFYGHVTTTKTMDPRRVALPKFAIDVLAQHREKLVREQHPGVDTGLMFPSRTGGHRPNTVLRKPLHKASRAAGLDIMVTPRVLRRSFNSLLLAQATDRIVVRSMMGHTSEEMTERYAGVSDEQKRAAVIKLARFLE